MISNPEAQLAASLARAMVAHAAPHELPIFRAASRAYFADPNRALRARSANEMLGFGAESAEALTPYALAIANAVVAVLGDELGAVRLLPEQGGEAQAEVARLTSGHVSRVRAVSLQKARELGLEDDKGVLLADAMVESLASAAS